jgi:phosphatidate phosphatase PAH1
MKKALLLFMSFIMVAYAYNQTWTDPIQINTLDGTNRNPDFCIDNEGTLHCVWSYKIETNFYVIYYSKSNDYGLSWSTPENISQNTSLWMENPHIVSDSHNNLHLTYDYNTGST